MCNKRSANILKESICSRRYKVWRREGRATATGSSAEGAAADRGDQTESCRERCSRSSELALLVHGVGWLIFAFVSLNSENPKAEKQDTFVEKLVTQVIKNLQVKISNIHVRYEDDVSTSDTFCSFFCWSFYVLKSVMFVLLCLHLWMCFIIHKAWSVADFQFSV